MARGIDLARPEAPLHAEVIEHFKEQLLIVFLKRLGGKVSVPVDQEEVMKRSSPLRLKPLRFGPGPRGDFTPPEEDINEPRKTLSDGTQIYPGHTNLRPSGQQEGYIVLAEEERAKGFVRPVRHSYTHLKCGTVTTMGQTLAETYARDPKFYSGTFCCGCGAHFPVGEKGEFVWAGTSEKVGTVPPTEPVSLSSGSNTDGIKNNV